METERGESDVPQVKADTALVCDPPAAAWNAFGQPVGAAVPGWVARARPPRTAVAGRVVSLEPLDPARHGDSFFANQSLDRSGRNWTYLFTDQPADRSAFDQWLAGASTSEDPQFHAVVDNASGEAVGVLSLMRIDPANGVIEVGSINFTPRLQRTVGATEAIVLLMRRVFDELGYRRFEWKCDHLNVPSRAAAARFGFRFEGIFRQALVYKGRSRDTAWFSILDGEWPALKAGFEAWLDPANFDAAGWQRRPLGSFMPPE